MVLQAIPSLEGAGSRAVEGRNRQFATAWQAVLKQAIFALGILVI